MVMEDPDWLDRMHQFGKHLEKQHTKILEERYVGRTVRVRHIKSDGLVWDKVIRDRCRGRLADAINEGKVFGTIVWYDRIGELEKIKINIKEPYKSDFIYCDLAFKLSDVEVLENDILKDIDFEI